METGLLGGITVSLSRTATHIPYEVTSTQTPCLKNQTMGSFHRITTPTWRAKGAQLTRWPPQWGVAWVPVATTVHQLEAHPARTTGTLQLARHLVPLFTASRLITRTVSGATAACGMTTTRDPRALMWLRPVLLQLSGKDLGQDLGCRSKTFPMQPVGLSRTLHRPTHTAPTPILASRRVSPTHRP